MFAFAVFQILRNASLFIFSSLLFLQFTKIVVQFIKIVILTQLIFFIFLWLIIKFILQTYIFSAGKKFWRIFIAISYCIVNYKWISLGYNFLLAAILLNRSFSFLRIFSNRSTISFFVFTLFYICID